MAIVVICLQLYYYWYAHRIPYPIPCVTPQLVWVAGNSSRHLSIFWLVAGGGSGGGGGSERFAVLVIYIYLYTYFSFGW